jgi:hypothetical protein
VQGFSVSQWLEFGLELPQYKEAFTRNAVTVLDFPLILEEPHLLEQELDVTSMLHRRQITRAMRSIALGIGTLPAPVQAVRHEGTAEGAMAVTWKSPKQACLPAPRSFDSIPVELISIMLEKVKKTNSGEFILSQGSVTTVNSRGTTVLVSSPWRLTLRHPPVCWHISCICSPSETRECRRAGEQATCQACGDFSQI